MGKGMDPRDAEEEVTPRCGHQLEAGGEERRQLVMFGFWLSNIGTVGVHSSKRIEKEKV